MSQPTDAIQKAQEDQYLDVKTLTDSLIEEEPRLQHTSSTRSYHSNSSVGRLLEMAKSGPNQLQNFSKEAAKDKKRLSQMLERLNAESSQMHFSNSSLEDDLDIINKKSSEFQLQRSPERSAIASSVPTTARQYPSHSDLNSDNNYHSANQSIDSFEFGQPENNVFRNSITSIVYSDYTPSIHEAEEIQVVSQDVSNNTIEFNRDSTDDSNNTPKTLLKKVIAGSTEELSKSDMSLRAPSVLSESSKYPSSEYSKAEFEPPMISKNSNNLSSSIHKRVDSKDSSVFDIPLGELNTKANNTLLPQDPARSNSVNLNPSIPSRSPNRPSSTTARDLREKLRKQRPHSIEITAMDGLLNELSEEVSRPGSEAGFTFVPSPDLGKMYFQKESQHSKENPSTPRPLPPPPVPTHTHKVRKSVASNIAFEEPITSPRLGTNTIPEHDDNDGFVTEDEEKEQLPTTAVGKDSRKYKRRSTKSTRSKHSHSTSTSSNSNFTTGTGTTSRRSMNHDTLMKLFQVTEGTIIGQEFQDLGLDDSEKQLLERLVDSLSRLTADMIIDGDRKTESARRLTRAIKALEGF